MSIFKKFTDYVLDKIAGKKIRLAIEVDDSTWKYWKQGLETIVASAIVSKHWDAVEETMRKMGYNDDEVKAGRAACIRLIEHML